MATTWDPAAKSVNISLGRMNVVAGTNASSGTLKGVRGTTSLSTGKKYLELIVGFFQNGDGFIAGFGNASFNTASYPGNDANSFGFQTQGSTYGVSGGWQSTLFLGTVWQFAIDLGAKLVWARHDRSLNWNGSGTADPATGVGGKPYTVTGALFPVWSGLGDGSTQNVAILNAGGFAFAGAIPSGFTAWDTATPTGSGAIGTPATWDPANKNTNIVLGAANLLATQNTLSNTWAGVRSTVHLNSGQFYVEKTISQYDLANGIIAGVADSAWSPTTNGQYPGVGRQSTGVGVGVGGWYWNALTNSGQPGTSPMALGHVMGYAIDANRGLIFVRDVTAGGNYNNDAAADPVLGRRGAWIPFLDDVYLAFSGNRVGGAADAILLNAGASAFLGTPPTGYIGIDLPAVSAGLLQTAVSMM